MNLQQEQAHFEGEEGWEEESVSWISHCPDPVLYAKIPSFCQYDFSEVGIVEYHFCRADPFAKKDWYDIKAPNLFQVRQVGKTLVTRTQGTKVCLYASECTCVLICIYLYKMYVCVSKCECVDMYILIYIWMILYHRVVLAWRNCHIHIWTWLASHYNCAFFFSYILGMFDLDQGMIEAMK